MAGVTIFALISYVVMPEEAWLPQKRLSHFIDSKGVRVEESESGVPSIVSGDDQSSINERQTGGK